MNKGNTTFVKAVKKNDAIVYKIAPTVKNWSQVRHLKNGHVIIKDVAFMKIGITFLSGFQLTRFGVAQLVVDENKLYAVKKQAKHFYSCEVLKKWEGKPILADSEWEYDKKNIVGKVKNVRRVGDALFCDLHISKLTRYRERIDDGHNLICAAYLCRYVCAGNANTFVQEDIIPSHLFMASCGIPYMEFPLPSI